MEKCHGNCDKCNKPPSHCVDMYDHSVIESLDFKEPKYVYKVTLNLLGNKKFTGNFSTHHEAERYAEYSKHDSMVLGHTIERIVKK